LRRHWWWLVPAALLALLSFMPHLDRMSQERQVRDESARVLAGAKKAMAGAVPGPPGAPLVGPRAKFLATGDRGVLLEIEDFSWIVIHCERGSHPKSSLAVALDSSGQWYVSEQYSLLPDAFSNYRRVQPLWWESRRHTRIKGQPFVNASMLHGINLQLSDVEGSATLKEARQKLQRLGFRPVPP
jgi:hypothetical protein